MEYRDAAREGMEGFMVGIQRATDLCIGGIYTESGSAAGGVLERDMEVDASLNH